MTFVADGESGIKAGVGHASDVVDDVGGVSDMYADHTPGLVVVPS